MNVCERHAADGGMLANRQTFDNSGIEQSFERHEEGGAMSAHVMVPGTEASSMIAGRVTPAPRRTSARSQVLVGARSGARSCTYGEAGHAARPSGLPPVVASTREETRLYLTRRGMAVIVAAVALVVGVMMATIVTAFLAVSPEPGVGEAAPATVMVAVDQRG